MVVFLFSTSSSRADDTKNVLACYDISDAEFEVLPELPAPFLAIKATSTWNSRSHGHSISAAARSGDYHYEATVQKAGVETTGILEILDVKTGGFFSYNLDQGIKRRKSVDIDARFGKLVDGKRINVRVTCKLKVSN